MGCLSENSYGTIYKFSTRINYNCNGAMVTVQKIMLSSGKLTYIAMEHHHAIKR